MFSSAIKIYYNLLCKFNLWLLHLIKHEKILQLICVSYLIVAGMPLMLLFNLMIFFSLPQFVLQRYDNPLSKKLNDVVNEIRRQRCSYLRYGWCSWKIGCFVRSYVNVLLKTIKFEVYNFLFAFRLLHLYLITCIIFFAA